MPRRPLFTTIVLAAGALVLGSPFVSVAAPVSPASSSGSPLAAASTTGDPVIGAVGDMACDPAASAYNKGSGTSSACGESRVSNRVVADAGLQAVLGLGDYQYECGDPSDYAVSYNPTWGRVGSLMKPVAGNHEYQTGRDSFGAICPSTNTTAQSYFNHFSTRAHPETHGHFSFNVGSWHLIGLNANCYRSGVGGCAAANAQTTWLKADLNANNKPCILAFWHQPLFTDAQANDTTYLPWWKTLYAAHADVVLNAHYHNYQRYPAVNPSGAIDRSNGITEYVVGTGGESLRTLANPGAVPQPVARLATFGYLRLTLHPSGWSSQFVNSNGTIRDTASGTCHP